MTATSDRIMSERTVIREILQTLAKKEMREKSPDATSPATSNGETGWMEFVTEEIASLPWYEKDLPDGRTPPQPRAAVGLINLLAAALKSDTIAPSSVNTTWNGGVAVEWHIGGMDLEITCLPNGTTEYSFEDRTGEEYEGPATEAMTLLRQIIRKLPASRGQAA